MVSLPFSLRNEMTKTTRWQGLLLVGFGLLLIAVAAQAILSNDSSSGDVGAVEQALRPELPGPIELGPPPTSAAIAPGTPASEAAPLPAPADEQPVQESAPIGLRIDRLSVDAPVGAYGVNQRTGQMAVPNNVTDVGWYKFGPSPGEPGSAVLAAHVDLANSGPGVFFDLQTLEAGDQVVVLREDGSEDQFRVVARTTYEKDDLPLEVIFSREGPPVLTLITCGGGFNTNLSRYDSNVVVFAVPDLGTELPEGSTL